MKDKDNIINPNIDFKALGRAERAYAMLKWEEHYESIEKIISDVLAATNKVEEEHND